MQPLYFNPLDSTGNFIGDNPLGTEGVPIKTSFYPYFNPSIYQSFTFYSFPIQTIYDPQFITGNSGNTDSTLVKDLSSALVGTSVGGDYTYSTVEFYSILAMFSTQFSTFETFYASYLQLNPITYSVRFGTQSQAVSGNYNGATDTFNTYEFCYSTQYLYYSYIVRTTQGGVVQGSNVLEGLQIATIQSGVFFNQLIGSNFNNPPAGLTYLGSSSFVNIMGNNIYTGLIDTTNSIIIYQNEQVSSYYSQSLSYQVNIANLTAALNSVSGGSDSNQGQGFITVTNFVWVWESTAQGWTGSQLTNFNGYLSEGVSVNQYLSVTYGGTVISHSTVAVTQVQSLITVQNNNLANSQTFMNNAVTTLQSQVSLAGQIIGTLSSIMQSIIGNI